MSDEGKDIDISHDDLQRKEERGGEGGKFEKKEDVGLGTESEEKENVRSVSGDKSQERFLRTTLETVLRGVHDQLELLDACIEQIGETSEGLSLEDRQRIEGILEKARAVREKIQGIREEPEILHETVKALIVPGEQVEQVNTANRALSEEVLLPLRNGALKIATEGGRNEKEIMREMRRKELVEQVCFSLLQIQGFHKGEEFGASEWVANAILRELRVLKSGDHDELQDLALVMNEIAARFAQLESEGSTQEENTKRAGEILLYTIRGLETDPDWSSQERKAILGAFQVMRANLRVEEGRSLVDVEVQKALTGEEELQTFETWKDINQYCSKRSHNIVNMDHPQAERELENLLTAVTRQTVYRITFNEEIFQFQKKQGSWWSRKKKPQEADKRGNLGALPQPVREEIIEKADIRWGALERDIRLFGARLGTYHAFELLCRNLPSPSGNTSFFAEYEKEKARALIYPINRPSQESRQRFFEAPHSLEFVEAVVEKLEEGDVLTQRQVTELCGIIRAFLSNVFLVSHHHSRRLESSIPASFQEKEALDLVRFGHVHPGEKAFPGTFPLSLVDKKERLKYALSTELPLLDQATSAVIQPKLLSVISRFLQLENQQKEITELQRICTYLFLPTGQGNFDPHYVENSVVQREYLTKDFLLSVLKNIPGATFSKKEAEGASAGFLSEHIVDIRSLQDLHDLIMSIPSQGRDARLNFVLSLTNMAKNPEHFPVSALQKFTPEMMYGMESFFIEILSTFYSDFHVQKDMKKEIIDLVSRCVDIRKRISVKVFPVLVRFTQKTDDLEFHRRSIYWLDNAFLEFSKSFWKTDRGLNKEELEEEKVVISGCFRMIDVLLKRYQFSSEAALLTSCTSLLEQMHDELNRIDSSIQQYWT